MTAIRMVTFELIFKFREDSHAELKPLSSTSGFEKMTLYLPQLEI